MNRWIRVRPGRGRSDEDDVVAIRELLGPLDPAAGRPEPVMAAAPTPRARPVLRRLTARPARLAAAAVTGTLVAAGATATAIAGLSQEAPSESYMARCFFGEGIDPDRPIETQFVTVAFGRRMPLAAETALEVCNSTYADPLPFAPQVVPPGRAVCVTDGIASVFPVRPGVSCAELGLPEAVTPTVP